MERYITYKDEWGASMDALTDNLEKPVKIYEGNIFKTREDDGSRRHYSIESVADNDLECEVRLREVRPQGYKSLLLAGILVGTWFIIKYIFTSLGFVL